MIFNEFIFSALIVGLLGAGHCVGMCGGIGAALTFALPSSARSSRLKLLMFYNLGRVCSYTLMGFLVGMLGSQLSSAVHPSVPVLRLVAALMMVLMGFYVTGWWRVLTVLERLGGVLWRWVQPISAKLMPIKNAGAAFITGCLWGWLPCGLVYSALALSLSAANPTLSALTMLAFGVGTLPALLFVGVIGDRLKIFLQRGAVRASAGLALICFGLWTGFFALQHAGSHHTHHGNHGAEHHAH